MKIKKKYQPLLWVVFGAAYGLIGRVLTEYGSHAVGTKMISISMLFAIPFAIGAIVVYGLRQTKPSIGKMIFAPWLAILLALAGSAVSLLEGSICIVLASPLFFAASSTGGLIMGLVLRWTNIRQINSARDYFPLPCYYGCKFLRRTCGPIYR